MGGYVAQVYAETYPEKLTGLVTIDYPPLQRSFYTSLELWRLKNIEWIYRIYPWNALKKSGSKGVAVTDYGRNLMFGMMKVYDNDKER